MIEVSLTVEPAFGYPLEIELSTKEITYKGDVRLTGKILQDSQRKINIKKTDYEYLIGNTEFLTLPVSPRFVHGLDGITYEIEIRDGLNGVRYSWWQQCPKEWEQLNQLANRLIKCVRLHVSNG